ncbi:MAG TPA: hypothetical protein VJ673_13680 [Aromatoleum sp.]|uniref:hypothetical protein n=1 Tax=Aromatoleum sp. TaxID=2307007 RepID=UPI002B48F559|nr:hypothetical protein [Aromatoleum sp.]HJV26733.1 hypothetical protein [Aromatoleum sp.]
MLVTNDPGLYIIRCKANGAMYAGAGKKGRKRLQGQLRSLSRGDNGCELLQADWNRYGPDDFEIRCLHVSPDELAWLEQVVIRHLKSLEEHGGYNKALGKPRALAARIRDTETKLCRKGKFTLLKTVAPHARIAEVIARTFQQRFHRLADETDAAEQAITFDPDWAETLLGAFEIVALAELTRTKKKVLH